MYDDLVKRLRTRHANEYQTADLDALDAAYRIEELERAVLDLAQHVPTADLMFYTKPETRLVFRKLMEKQNDPTSTINPQNLPKRQNLICQPITTRSTLMRPSGCGTLSKKD